MYVLRRVKAQRVAALEKRGLNPRDERVAYLTRKAAYAAYGTFLAVSAPVVLAGRTK